MSTETSFLRSIKSSRSAAAPLVPPATLPIPVVFRTPVGWLLEPDPFRAAASIALAIMAINPFLWQASLGIVDQYPLKIVDSQGGFISTEWIMENTSPDQRCNIKVTINSQELVSNGVKVKLICQKKTDGAWYNESTSYTSEEKDLTLKILETAIQLKAENELS